MSPRILLPLLLLGLGGLALAEDPPPEAPAAPAEPAATTDAAEAATHPRFPVERWAVDPGTDALMVVDKRVPLIDMAVQVPVGAASAWFRESSAESAWTLQSYDEDGTLRARADDLAVEISLSTAQYRSTLSVRALRRDADAVAQLLHDVLTSSSIDPEEAKRAIKGVKIGWKSNLKDPDFRLTQASLRLFFAPGDPRRVGAEEPVPPTKDTKKLLAVRDEMVRLPGRRIGFAGDIDRAEADRLARIILPPVGATPPNLQAAALEELSDQPPAYAEKMPNLTQVYFSLCTLGVAYDDPRFPALMVANHVLGGHFFSRLYVALRHEGGETYGARARGLGGVNPDLYSLYTFTRVENREQTEAKLREVLATFARDGITEAERADAVSALLGGRRLDIQAPGDALDEAMRLDAIGLPPDFNDAWLGQAAGLSLEQINAEIAKFYEPARFTLVTVEPE